MCRVVLSVSSLALCGAAIFIPGAAWSRDKTPPPPPCALTATLRVADAASLAGIQSLQGCSNIIVAPGTPAEMPRDVRIAPEAEEGSSGDRAASFQLVSEEASRGGACVSVHASCRGDRAGPPGARVADRGCCIGRGDPGDAAGILCHPL